MSNAALINLNWSETSNTITKKYILKNLIKITKVQNLKKQLNENFYTKLTL